MPTEAPRHFIDIDAYGSPPFTEVPRRFADLQKQFGAEAAERWGVAPWAIAECYENLVEALSANDWSGAGYWASDLGHYVADTHQPLHCTLNYDGQKSGNKGVHLRFEIHMMDHFYDEATLPLVPPARAVAALPEGCFAWIAEA